MPQTQTLKTCPVKNIHTYPLLDADPFLEIEKNAALIIPDLHANPLLLLQYLLRSKIMSWRENGEHYWDRICNFIHVPAPDPLTDADPFAAYMKKFVTEFENLIAAAQFDVSHPLLMLGDTLGDRGPNDWFMLLFLSVLRKKRVKYRINFSNHDYETYCWAMLDKFSEVTTHSHIINAQRTSLINFINTYHYCSDTRKRRMRELYHKAYLPYVTLFAYSYDKKNKCFTLTTHAPCSEGLLCDIASEFKIKIPNLERPSQFKKLVIACNKQFRKLLRKAPETIANQYCNFPHGEDAEKEQCYPGVLRAIWGRNYEFTEGRHRVRERYSKNWLCGHLGAASRPLRVTNLDASNLGKIDITEGNLCYSTCCSDIVTNIHVKR